MGADSKIEWCDHTFNPWEGCTKVSPGCANCYAEARNARFGGGTSPNWGKGAPRRRTSPHNWDQPRKWNRDAAAAKHSADADRLNNGYGYDEPHRPRVFCASLADWLDDEVSPEWLTDLLQVIHETPNLDWLLLTKRPENFATRMQAAWDAREERNMGGAALAHNWKNGDAPKNVWIGTTVEDQARAHSRIVEVLGIPAWVHFLSCEPLLELVKLDLNIEWKSPWPTAKINWVICGGESGPGARPMHPDWARSLRDQCAAVGVPFLFKQWGEWSWPHPMSPMEREKGETMFKPDHFRRLDDNFAQIKVGKKITGRLLDGIEHNAFPA